MLTEKELGERLKNVREVRRISQFRFPRYHMLSRNRRRTLPGSLGMLAFGHVGATENTRNISGRYTHEQDHETENTV